MVVGVPAGYEDSVDLMADKLPDGQSQAAYRELRHLHKVERKAKPASVGSGLACCAGLKSNSRALFPEGCIYKEAQRKLPDQSGGGGVRVVPPSMFDAAQREIQEEHICLDT